MVGHILYTAKICFKKINKNKTLHTSAVVLCVGLGLRTIFETTGKGDHSCLGFRGILQGQVSDIAELGIFFFKLTTLSQYYTELI